MGDYENILNTAREEAEKLGWSIGHAKGHAEGHAKGALDAKIEIARKMLLSGMSTEQIMEFTGIEAEKLNSLN